MILKTFATIFFLSFWSITILATPGCLVIYGGTHPTYDRVYTARYQISPQRFETTSNLVIFPNPRTDCTRTTPVDQRNSTYLLTSSYTTTGSLGDCRLRDNQSGTPVDYTVTYRCPIDDYIPWLISPIAVLVFFQVRTRNFVLAKLF